jgi:hypothetical protein
VLYAHCPVFESGYWVSTLDVSRPSAPRQIGEFQVAGSIRDLEIVGDMGYALLKADPPRLEIWDTEYPAAPVTLGSLSLDHPYLVAASEPNVYVIEAELDTRGRYYTTTLTVVDATSPERPVREGELVMPETAGIGMAAQGDLVVISDTRDGEILVIDASDPQQPRVVGSHWIADDPGDVWLRNGVAFVGANCGASVVSLSKPSQPELVAEMWHDGCAHTSRRSPTVVLDDDLIYVLDEGIGAFSVADPAAPSLVGQYYAPDHTSSLGGPVYYGSAAVGGYLYSIYEVTGLPAGMVVLQGSAALSPSAEGYGVP